MSATQRITWLKRNILQPAARLEAALLPENRPKFVYWEDLLSDQRDDDLADAEDDISFRLSLLKEKAKKLIAKLRSDLEMKVETTDEIRFSIVFDAIQDLRDFYPDFQLSRGNYDSELKQVIGILPEFVRRVFFETTGHHERLDGPIQLVLHDMRKLQSGSS
jgi:hypothetical protein